MVMTKDQARRLRVATGIRLIKKMTPEEINQTFQRQFNEIEELQTQNAKLQKERDSLLVRVTNCEQIFSDAPDLEFSKFEEMFPDEFKAQNAKLQQELKTAKADGVKAFVSDTTETGQISWSDCQWLDDWVNEWLEQKELIPPTQEQGE